MNQAAELAAELLVLNQGVAYAQEVGREEGFQIGQTVAHPSDPLSYEIEGINGDTVTVVILKEDSGTGQEVRKELPLDGLFDLYIARKKACELYAASLLRGSPMLN